MSTPTVPARRPSAPRGFTPAVLGVGALLLAAIVTGHLSGSAGPHVDWADFMPIAAVTFTVVGALVVPRQPRNPVGWLFLAVGGASALSVLGASYGGHPVGAWLYAWMPAVAYGLVPLALLLFPGGTLPSPRWRPLAWFTAAATATTAAGFAIAAWDNPALLVVPSAPPGALSAAWITARVGLVCVIVAVAAASLSLVVRWRQAGGIARQQLKWLWLGSAAIPVSIVANLALVPGAWAVAAVTVPAAAGVAILKYRLYDIDLFLNRSLVYAVLTVLVVGGYVAIVAALSAVFTGDEAWQRIVAAGLVALAFAPLRERVQRAANQLLYGERDNPYAVVSRLARRLERAVDPTTVLPQLVETIADALHLPYAAIELADASRPAVSYGRRIGRPEAFDMVHQGEVVGRLLVSKRSAEVPFTRAEQSLIEDLARQAGLATRTVGLTAELQRSHERLLRSREEERRRLRRDLHDGLGPALAGMTMQIGAARALLPGTGGPLELLLEGLEQQLQACVGDIRRLVDDLRPTVLDRLGLVGAIRHRAATFSAEATNAELAVEVSAPEDLPELPAAVEVAAYRIATEALTNVVRHACARRAMVTLDLDGGLVIEVVDDGVGGASDRGSGVGLTSMRERTAELGGSIAVESPQTGGTRVRAVLPLRSP
jgi:signal transduction histidine kinase